MAVHFPKENSLYILWMACNSYYADTSPQISQGEVSRTRGAIKKNIAKQPFPIIIINCPRCGEVREELYMTKRKVNLYCLWVTNTNKIVMLNDIKQFSKKN